MTGPQREHRPDSSGRRFGTKEGGARIRGPRRTDQFGTASTLRTLPLLKEMYGNRTTETSYWSTRETAQTPHPTTSRLNLQRPKPVHLPQISPNPKLCPCDWFPEGEPPTCRSKPRAAHARTRLNTRELNLGAGLLLRGHSFYV